MALLTSSVFAADLSGSAWKVYNINAGNSKWDINKAPAIGGGTGVSFNFQPYSGSVTSGWFSVYLLTNYNANITGKTLSATVNVGVTPGTLFYTRSTCDANDGTLAYVRLEFQSASSNYGPSSYWWSTGTTWNLSTLAATNGGWATLSLSTASAAAWTNINGQSGLDDPAGFAAAMKGVKQVGLAFGSSCRYASGVAVSGSGRFEMTNYTIQ